MLETKISRGWIVPLCDPMPMIDDLLEHAILKADAHNLSVVRALAFELAERRRRPIQLIPFHMEGTDQYGCWLTDIQEHFDFIFYECRMPSCHQEHTILHELGHIMLGHRTYHVGSPRDLAAMAQLRTLRRDNFEEEEAERLASLFWKAILDKVGLQGMLQRAGNTGWSDVFGGMRLDQ